jgi:hypothetical protein
MSCIHALHQTLSSTHAAVTLLPHHYNGNLHKYLITKILFYEPIQSFLSGTQGLKGNAL